MATSTPSSEHLQHQLALLQAENQSLLHQEASLVSQLEIIRQKLALSKEEIFKMETMVNEFLLDQEAQGQSDFWEAFNKNEYVFRGLSKLIDRDPPLKTAFQAVAGSRSTDTHEKLVLIAILTQLSGQPASILTDLAKKVLLHNTNGHAPVLAQNVLSDAANTAVDLTDDDTTDAARHSSIVSLGDSDIKAEYEEDSTTSMFRSSPIPPASAPGPAKRSFETLIATPTRQILLPRASTQPKSHLRDLLSQLRDTPAPQPVVQPNANSVVPATVTPPESEGGRPTKRLKPLKDVAIPAAFSLLMKKLEVAHAQNALSITSLLKCAKCQQIKRDARVLNCLHVYCHRCTQKLRVEAETGNPKNGFKAYCVVDNCTEMVSGKTAVIDAEVMELLVWYDKQSPGLTTSTAQIQVLKNAHQKRPDEAIIKSQLAEVRKQQKQREATGENDTVCNLLEVAKLAKKLA